MLRCTTDLAELDRIVMSTLDQYPAHWGPSGGSRPFTFSAPILSTLVAVLDCILVVAVGLAAVTFYAGWDPINSELYIAAVAFVCLAIYILFRLGNLYTLEAIMAPVRVVNKTVVGVITAFFLLMAMAFSLKISEDFSRIWMYLFAGGSCAVIAAERMLVYWALTTLSARNLVSRSVVVLGTGKQAEAFLNRIAVEKPCFTSIAGVFDLDLNTEPDQTVAGYPVLGTFDDLFAYARVHPVDDVVIATPWSNDDAVISAAKRLKELPAKVYLGSDLIGFRLNLVPAPNNFGSAPLAEISDKPLAGWRVVAKSVEDYTLATLFLLAAAPVMIFTAIAIKLESPGPVFFRQKRLGFNNKVFEIYKFRSMYCQPEGQAGSRVVQAKRDDPRVTRVGRIIRKTSIDELPQLFNVLNGTMSLIGPRPHAVEHNAEYSTQIGGYFARHNVKPGITGWAQVKGYRGETTNLELMENRVYHDVEYADNWSLMLDIKILLMTIFVVLSGRNAY